MIGIKPKRTFYAVVHFNVSTNYNKKPSPWLDGCETAKTGTKRTDTTAAMGMYLSLPVGG